MTKKNILSALAMLLALTTPVMAQDVVRGLKTVLIEEVDTTISRRYPSVLVPADVSTMSFEVGGKLNEVTLDIGQSIRTGDVLASLDETSFQLDLQRAHASVEQAQAQFDSASETLARQKTLLERGSATKVSVDNANTSAVSARAQLEQAQAAYETAQKTLTKTKLMAPFNGFVNTVGVQSFGNVAAGATVATLYRSDSFEVKFTVNFDTVNMLALGKEAHVRLAARPSTVLTGRVTEIGARADQVSSFPVVVTVTDAPADVRAGLAVEAELDFSLISSPGYSIPLSALIGDNMFSDTSENAEVETAGVYLFDEATSTVKRHSITIFGVRNNQLLVADGLKPGDRVASAGVPFLREGMKVKLLADK
ncbi:efflux RND transporter periplasmic adaptor subunit [Pseudophaeobacter sp.]|uniref:efflux RND transporter periplasmic adaptor subunit n=1 Tax=Pseudophaeobacter sp. TaxID=1971739 RepID=UPI003296B14D